MELFDLVALASDSGKRAPYARVRRFVRQASSMNSVQLDLEKAIGMMRRAWELQAPLRASDIEDDDQADEGLALTLQALFGQALLLYTRATHSRGKGRNKLQIIQNLDSEMRGLHDRLVALRDRHFAHFEGASAWEEHEAVLAFDGEQQRIALSYPHQVYYIRADDAAALNRLLPHALSIARTAYQDASERLNLELNQFFETDPDFLEVLRKHRFDPHQRFMADEADEYLGAIEADRSFSRGARVIRARRQGSVE